MKRKEKRTVMVTYCDVCGEECGSHTVYIDPAGQEQHACQRFDEESGKLHRVILLELLEAKFNAA